MKTYADRKNNTAANFSNKNLNKKGRDHLSAASGKFNNPATHSSIIQTKLAMEEPGGRHEEEVDAFNNPIRFIDPDGRIPPPIEGAKIADHIYDGKIGDVLDGRWILDTIYLNSENPAYKAGLYSRTVDGVTEYTFANAGTYFERTKRGYGSISEDVEQPFGGSENMKVSLADAKTVSEQLGKAELTFVGHSKGAAEAAGNALATNRNALLYNPAAINSKAYGLDSKSYTGADDNGMTAYIVKGDVLNTFINSWLAKPIDKVVYLPKQSSNPLTNHSMESMIKALEGTEENPFVDTGTSSSGSEWFTAKKDNTRVVLPRVKDIKFNFHDIQNLGNISFNSNLARKGSSGNLIVKDIKTSKDFGVIRNGDGAYKFNGPNIQNLGSISFDSNKTRKGSSSNLIVKDIKTGKDFGVIRNSDGSYAFTMNNH